MNETNVNETKRPRKKLKKSWEVKTDKAVYEFTYKSVIWAVACVAAAAMATVSIALCVLMYKAAIYLIY